VTARRLFVIALIAALGSAGHGLAQEASPSPAAFDIVESARAAVGPPRGVPLSGAALDARTARVAGLLRCPVCQGLSVADSPATMAQNMRAQVRDLLAAGYEDEQVLAYFEASYGEFVRLAPAFRGVNRLVWLAPLAGLLLGAVVVAVALRRGGRASPASPPPAVAVEEGAPWPLPDDARLAAYVLRVREDVHGWPGGVRPPSPPVSGNA
jgi:cytochrome c-type biogenesis protein CcmH